METQQHNEIKHKYKNYRTCLSCGIEFPLTREYFRRNTIGKDEHFHHKCRECEVKERREKEWKDGKLLCHKCGEFKPENEFSQNSNKNKARNCRKVVCRKCDAERQRHLDIRLNDDKKLKKCMNFRFLGARDRAKKNNIDFDIDLAFLLDLWNKQEKLCALSGIPMTFELKKGRVPTNVSIDRINHDLGYTKDNVQLVCMACNQIKSDLSESEMYSFCKNIVVQYERRQKK